jgi:hypothetical protein
VTALPLVPHPDAPPKSGFIVHAWARRVAARELHLTFRIADSVPKIAWHNSEHEGRVDELWKHTCFEAFIRAGACDNYIELNLAPAKRWALYEFDDYREGLRDAADAMVSQMRFSLYERLSIPVCRMRATLNLPPSFADKPWALGMSIIIEEKDGTKSYWALKHPDGPPDFHNADCFVARLPAPERA